MLRRMLAKQPKRLDQVKQVLTLYQAQGREGTMQDHTFLPALAPAPPPGDPGATAWKTKWKATGPISLLLGSLYRAAAVIDMDLSIHHAHEVPIQVLNSPWQHLKTDVLEVAVRARFAYAATQRRALGEWKGFDARGTITAIQKRGEEDQAILRGVATLARWDEKLQNEIGNGGDETCVLCGAKGMPIRV